MDRTKLSLASLLSVTALFTTMLTAGAGAASAVPVPVVQPGAKSVAEGNSATTNLRVPVTLSSASTQTVTVQWNTYVASGAPSGQADPATDYTPASGTVTFAPGTTSKTVTISVNGDTLIERDEFVLVSFHNATNATVGGFYGLGSGTIKNDDPTINPGSASVREGDADTTPLDVPVTLSAASDQTVTVQWTTYVATGTVTSQADPSTDYTPTSGTVTFAPGETAKTVTVSVTGDTLVEPDEFVLVSFRNPTNAGLGGFYGLGAGTITNDDSTTATATCLSGAPCDSATASSSDGTTTLQVSADASAGAQTVTATVGVGNLVCTLPGSGSVTSEYHTTAPDAAKIADYTVLGDAATFAQNFYAAHTDISGCYGAAEQFNGYSPVYGGTWADGPYVYGPAQFQYDGVYLYEAFLGSCANHSGYQPCFTNIAGNGANTTQVSSPASPSDPRISH